MSEQSKPKKNQAKQSSAKKAETSKPIVVDGKPVLTSEEQKRALAEGKPLFAMATPIVWEPRATAAGHDKLSPLEEGLRDALATHTSFAYHFLCALGIDDEAVRDKLNASLSRYGLETLLDRGRRKDVIKRFTSAGTASDFYEFAREKAKSSLANWPDETIEEKSKHCLEIVRALDKAFRVAQHRDKRQREVLRSIERDKTPQQATLERMVFGPADDQAKYRGDDHEPYWVAHFGFQNPADLWPNFEHLRLYYECVIFIGILASGQAAWMVPARAQFFADNADALAKSLDHPDFKKVDDHVYEYLLAFLGRMMGPVVSGQVMVNAICKSLDEGVPVLVYPGDVQHQAA
jgi:hypothetical protein